MGMVSRAGVPAAVGGPAVALIRAGCRRPLTTPRTFPFPTARALLRALPGAVGAMRDAACSEEVVLDPEHREPPDLRHTDEGAVAGVQDVVH